MNMLHKLSTPYTVRDEVLSVLKSNPNRTSKEIHSLVPHLSLAAVSRTVNTLKTRGAIVRTGEKLEQGPSGRSVTHWAYSAVIKEMNNQYTTKAAKNSSRASSSPSSSSDTDKLLATIKELESWKAMALERFPELAVCPYILKARKILADELAASGNNNSASAVLAGDKDNSISMRSLLRIIKEVA